MTTTTKKIAALSTTRAIQGFRTQVGHYHRVSLALLASSTVVLMVSLHAEEPTPFDATIMRLKGEISEVANIAQSQTYKILGLARKLVDKLSESTKGDGPLAKLLKAKTHDAAMAVVTGWLNAQKVKSVEDATVFLGLYQRAPQTNTGAGVMRAAAGGGGLSSATLSQAAPDTPVPRGKRAQAEAAKAKAEAEARAGPSPPIVPGTPQADQREGLTTTLKVMPSGMVVASLVRAGHDPQKIVVDLIPYLNTVDCIDRIVEFMAARRDFLVQMTRAPVIDPVIPVAQDDAPAPRAARGGRRRAAA